MQLSGWWIATDLWRGKRQRSVIIIDSGRNQFWFLSFGCPIKAWNGGEMSFIKWWTGEFSFICMIYLHQYPVPGWAGLPLLYPKKITDFSSISSFSTWYGSIEDSLGWDVASSVEFCRFSYRNEKYFSQYKVGFSFAVFKRECAIVGQEKETPLSLSAKMGKQCKIQVFHSSW